MEPDHQSNNRRPDIDTYYKSPDLRTFEANNIVVISMPNEHNRLTH